MQFNFNQDLTLASQYLTQLDKLSPQLSEGQKNERVEALKGRIDQCVQQVQKKADPVLQKEVDTLVNTWNQLKGGLKDASSLSETQYLKTPLQESIKSIRQRVLEIQDQGPSKEGKQERTEEKAVKASKGPTYLPSRETKQFIEFTKTSPEGLKWLQDSKRETVKIWISVLEHLKEGQYGAKLKQAAQEFDPSMTLQQNMLALMLYELAPNSSSPVPECFKPYQDQHPEEFKQLLKDLAVYRNNNNSLNFVESLFDQNEQSLTEEEKRLKKRIFLISSGVEVEPNVTEPLLKPIEFADLSRLFSSIILEVLPPDRNSVNYLISQKAFERAAHLANSISSSDVKLEAFKDIIEAMREKVVDIGSSLVAALDNIQEFYVLRDLKSWAETQNYLEIVPFIDNTPALKFQEAFEKEDFNQVTNFIKSGKVNPASNSNWAIRYACYKNNPQIVKLLLGIDKVDPTDNNNEAILLAAEEGYTEIVKLLLDTDKVDPAAQDNLVIILACEKGHTEIVKLLLDTGKIRNQTEVMNPACYYGHKEIVKLLLDMGKVDLAAKDNRFIVFASEQGHTEIVKLLLDTGKVDPTVDGNKALRLAVKKGHTEIVKLLLDTGKVDPTINDNELILLAAEEGYTEIVKLLLDTGKIKNQTEVMNSACYYGHKEIVKLLLDTGKVDLAAKDNRFIVFASEQGHTEIVKLLLDTGKVDPTVDGNKALRLAVKKGHTEIVKLLLDTGKVDPKANDSEAILLAVEKDYIEIVKLLLESVEGRSKI